MPFLFGGILVASIAGKTRSLRKVLAYELFECRNGCTLLLAGLSLVE